MNYSQLRFYLGKGRCVWQGGFLRRRDGLRRESGQESGEGGRVSGWLRGNQAGTYGARRDEPGTGARHIFSSLHAFLRGQGWCIGRMRWYPADAPERVGGLWVRRCCGAGAAPCVGVSPGSRLVPKPRCPCA